jgi:Rad3-related DNA helicase
VSITPHSLRRVFRALDETGSSFAESGVLQDTWTEMFKRLSFRDGEIPKDPFGALGDTAIELLSDLYDQTGVRMKDEGITGTNEDDIKAPDRVTYQQLAAFQVLKRSIDKPLAALKSCKEPDDNTVIFAATDPKRNKKITVSPIELGPMIGPKLHTIGSVVITSATLSVGGNFDHVRRQLGLDIEMKQVPGEPAIPQTRIVTQSLESPFDYKRQAVLYTPKHIPLPVRDSDTPEVKEAYYSALTNDIAQLINASKGNGFVLFSANTDLNEVHRRLEAEELAYPLILQGDNPNAAFKQYMSTPNAVLLGVKSFWEGVDVQGEKLQLVIITKLPFGRPDDPVIQAQSRHLTQYLIEKGMSEANASRQVFQAVQTPKMITDVRQGGGRLIRSTTDRGVFAILDCRVWTGRSSAPSKTQNSYGGYGGQLVTALGFPSRTSSMLDVQGYFKDLHNSRKSE